VASVLSFAPECFRRNMDDCSIRVQSPVRVVIEVGLIGRGRET